MNQEKSSIPAYIVKFILAGIRNGRTDEPVFLNFKSLPEVRGWADFTNYVLGMPERNVCTFSITHGDGSPLSEAELYYLQPENSEELFRNRGQKVIDSFSQAAVPSTASGLYDGARMAIKFQSLPLVKPQFKIGDKILVIGDEITIANWSRGRTLAQRLNGQKGIIREILKSDCNGSKAMVVLSNTKLHNELSKEYKLENGIMVYAYECVDLDGDSAGRPAQKIVRRGRPRQPRLR